MAVAAAEVLGPIPPLTATGTMLESTVDKVKYLKAQLKRLKEQAAESCGRT